MEFHPLPLFLTFVSTLHHMQLKCTAIEYIIVQIIDEDHACTTYLAKKKTKTEWISCDDDEDYDNRDKFRSYQIGSRNLHSEHKDKCHFIC